MSSSRWDEFSEEEMAAIMIAFAGNMIAMTAMTDERNIVTYLKAVLPMMDEMSERMGVETESTRNVRDMIAKLEEHRE